MNPPRLAEIILQRPHAPILFCNAAIARAAALAPVIVVTIGTCSAPPATRIFPSSVCGPFFVGVLMISCTLPFLMKSWMFGRPSASLLIRFAGMPPFDQRIDTCRRWR